MSDAFNERMRLIRFRRKHEHSTFRQELGRIPRTMVWVCFAIYLITLVSVVGANLYQIEHGGPGFVDDLHGRALDSSAALAGIITLCAVFFGAFIFAVGWVYQDAKRRGMNGALWVLLILILSPAYLFIGFVIYMLVRDPLPYVCPQCACTVSAKFNFCPNCKYNLHPSCPQCQREVSTTDKFCPYCATALGGAVAGEPKPATGEAGQA